MVNFDPLAAEIVSLVWGTPGNFNRFRVLTALVHGTLVVGVSETAAFNRGRHLYSVGRPSRWALAHISSYQLSATFTYLPTPFSCLTLVDRVTMWCELGEMNAMTDCRNSVHSYPVTVIRVPPACGPNSGRTSLSIWPTHITQCSIHAIIYLCYY